MHLEPTLEQQQAIDTSSRVWRTVQSAAARIGASTRSVYRAIDKKQLKAVSFNNRAGHGDWRTCDAWIDEWLLSTLGR